MALTTTQVNQAFLATLGRPAEGSAATWGSTSLSLDSLLNSIFIAENTEDFVESLYTELLGRASDAEGKAFWNSLLATTSKEAVLAQFKAAVLAAGQADPSNADYQGLIATNKAFVQALYTNLLGREADAEGLDFWANALATGMSRGDLISAFVSAALSDPNSDDAQTLNAKLSVADAYSAAFKDFGKDVTADEKKAAYAQLVEQMKEVVAGSTVEEFQDAINQFKGQNQDRKTDVFTKGEDDLDASESTAATTFRGTINISDSEKSTIESGDTATGNSEYAAANTLIVDVKSDGKEKDFNFGTETAGVKVSNVNNLTINNGTADVTLNLAGGDNYTGKVAITGKGDRADVTVAQDVASLNVSTSGTKKAYADTTVTATATLGSFEGSVAVDTLNISGTIAKSINTGDGKDNVTLEAAAKVYEKATISLGGGDDTLTINTSDIGNYNADGEITENLKASVTIDGGAGTKDKLVLNSDISKGVNAITGVEFIDSTNGAISAAAADGLKTTVSGGLTINANYKEVKSINLKDIKSFTNDSKEKTGSLTVQNVTNENITLSSNIEEIIILKGKDATSDNGYAEISKFASGDKIQVSNVLLTLGTTNLDGKKVDLTRYNAVKDYLNGASGDVVAINDTNGKASYIWQKIAGEAKLIAVADKTLKAAGTNFVLDTTKPKPDAPEQPSNAKVTYDKDNTTIDINSGFYGDGLTGQSFKAPVKEGDILSVFNVSGALTINDSGANKGTVQAFISNKASTSVTISGDNTSASKLDVYLGVGNNYNTDPQTYPLDASNYAFTNVDNVYANTSGELKLNTANFGTGNSQLDLSKVDANVVFSGAVTVGAAEVDLASYIATAGTPAKTTADSGDSISFTLKETSHNSSATVKATAAKDTITLGKVVDAKTVAIDLLSDKAIDTIDATANTLASSDILTGIYTVKGADTGDTIKFVSKAVSGNTIVSKSVATGGAISDLAGAIKSVATDANTLYKITVTGLGTTTDNGTYLVYNKEAAATLAANEDIVIKLDGNLDVSLSADKLGVVFA